MIIDSSYFFGDILIGQKSELSVQEALDMAIEHYETEFLTKLLGYEGYTVLKAGLQNPVQAFALELKNGKDYTYNGGLRKWRGLVEADRKRSPIAYYVYYNYQRDNVTTTGGTGEGKIQTQNSIPLSPYRKMISAWNNMVEWNRELYSFLDASQLNYPEMYTYANAFKGYELFTPINSFNI